MTSGEKLIDTSTLLNLDPTDDHQAIARYLTKEFVRRALGEGETEVVGNKPRSLFFAGTLAAIAVDDIHDDGRTLSPDQSENLLNDQQDHVLEFTPPEADSTESSEFDDVDSGALHMGARRVAPPSCGLRFHLADMEGSFQVHVRFHLWARAEPTASQFGEFAGEDLRPSEMPSRFVNVGTVNESGTLRLTHLEEDARSLTQQVNDRLVEIAREFSLDSSCYRVPPSTVSVPGERDEIEAWIGSYGGSAVEPGWRAQIEPRVRKLGDDLVSLDIRVVNLTRVPLSRIKNLEGTFFNVRLTVDTTGSTGCRRLSPTHFRSSDPRRAPVERLAMGLGCVAEELSHRSGTAVTAHIPVHGQHPIVQDERPGTVIRELADSPAPNVRVFLEALKASRGTWEDTLELFENVDNPDAHAKAREDMEAFEAEVDAIQETLKLLEGDGAQARRVQRAFGMTMEAVDRMFAATTQEDNQPRWRAFQLGFILSAIPRVVERAEYTATTGENASRYKPMADLIWFRTGGGKTEAFQALAVFHAFYDRLRGKGQGVTAWLRFALRALTVQQTQRLVDLVYQAELVRREAGLEGEPFSVGFLVGLAYTPTEIKPPSPRERPEHQADNTSVAVERRIRDDPKSFVFVQRCPHCRKTTIESRWAEDEWNIKFTCTNDDCPLEHLPLDVVDDSIRRNPPAFLVGTIDKIAGIGLTRKFQNLIRTPAWRCPTHGFTKPERRRSRAGKCRMRSPDPCQEEPTRFSCDHDWGPGIVIIDEVHLLEEELGAFTGQYASMLQEATMAGGDPPPYYVLASATVAGWKRHAKHLTGVHQENLRRFPSAPPTVDASFYYTTDMSRIQRYFLGIHPHGKTENDAMIHTLRISQSIIQELYRNRSLMESIVHHSLTPDQQARFLLPYARTICYVLALRQADGLRHSINVQLRQYMETAGYDPVRVSETISSRMPSSELADLLNRLEETVIRDDDDPDVVPASSSIAYGVDIANINSMILMGQPRRTSEDIQVTSRTGRKFTGIVYRLFHPVRQRDLVHYLHFHNYHVNQDLLVDDIAVNRFATRTPRRTMPGAIMALIFSTDEDRVGSTNPGFFLLEAKNLLQQPGQRDWFEEAVRRIYHTGDPQASPAFSRSVEDALEVNLNLIARATHEPTSWGTPAGLSSRPMTSLRDVDETITIVANQGPGSQGVQILRDAGLKDREMNRSRIQALFNHAPEQTYEFGNGQSIVRTRFVDDAFDKGEVGKINRVVMVTRLLPSLREVPALENLVYARDAVNKLASTFLPVRPGRIRCEVFPMTLRCRNRACAHVWRANFRSHNLRCPRDPEHGVGRQIRHMAVHHCGNAASLYVPKCRKHGRSHIQLDDRPQEVSRWRWRCAESDGGVSCTWRRPVMQKCFQCDAGTGGAT